MSRQQWTDFLQQQGIELDPEANAVIGAECAAEPQVVPLLERGALSLQGPQAEQFLQGQVTCDLNRLSTEQSLLGANCTPKGNVVSAFRLLKMEEESLRLLLPRAILEPALANLKKYIIFSKAELTDASDAWVGVGLQGAGAPALVEALMGSTPQAEGTQVKQDELVAVRVPGDRFEIWGPVAAMTSRWPQIAEGASVAPSRAWQRTELAAGLPQLDAQSVEAYLPHMLNLQALDAISFEKGCYTGQEVVARMQHRGKLKKLLYRGRVQTANAPETGEGLHTPQRRSVGKVLASVPLPEGGYEIQAIINKGAADEDELRLGDQDGPAVTLLALPYPIDPALFERPSR
ncbi:folate-binding protein YgfZ [Motiliproteus sp. SC1-56]|uniref:CAF17-like 4Fe-4S cluster assembly/insertion protein YgfZ n=1 Tax=Motiliproteus sp. SC1-56 TaxID=2799565 RepID=UPI001A905C1D|nr:folate-binding protein YgfZ [Motiliproteus sp. SC1-56]